MKALTVCQPFAHLIAIGAKFVENRKWNTRHRGKIAIHAGLSRDWLQPGDEEAYPDMAFGAVVATAVLSDVIHIDSIRHFIEHQPGAMMGTMARVARHEHTEGPWCWVLDDVTRLDEPVPWKGRQCLWPIPADFYDRKYALQRAAKATVR